MVEFSLYNYFRSSTSYRARIALNFKNISYEYKAINLLKSEQHSADYRALNPLGGVPTLVHNGKVIPDSTAIIEYLEETIPSPALMPADPYLRARIRQCCEIINSSIHPMGNLKVQKHLGDKYGLDQAQKEEWLGHWAHEGLKALEKVLQEFSKTYCFGDTVTLADLYLVPQILTCKRFKVDLTSYPTIMKVNENCLKLEAFRKAHPFIQIDTPEDLRVKS